MTIAAEPVAPAQRRGWVSRAKPVKSRSAGWAGVWACGLLASPRMRAAVLSVALIACAYRPGSFSHYRQSFPGQRTTVGCIDLSVERRPDLTTGGTVLAYEFGNRCDHPAPIDFTRVKVVARTYSGEDVTLSAYDPQGQIMPQRIDGRAIGAEAIAYPSERRLAEVCVDAAALAHAAPARWMCFASNLPPNIAEHVFEEEREEQVRKERNDATQGRSFAEVAP